MDIVKVKLLLVVVTSEYSGSLYVHVSSSVVVASMSSCVVSPSMSKLVIFDINTSLRTKP